MMQRQAARHLGKVGSPKRLVSRLQAYRRMLDVMQGGRPRRRRIPLRNGIHKGGMLGLHLATEFVVARFIITRDMYGTRSEDRRVGKACVSQFRSRGSPIN